ncbi:hypothetical protein ACQR1I_24925 [Bradyrhizobium sp. HKCCYLS2038]|uniref:hypothetical protein n=1 Tax=unclassified Bradyrhizobium TaxID=2631580 RepID=UPI003EB8451E
MKRWSLAVDCPFGAATALPAMINVMAHAAVKAWIVLTRYAPVILVIAHLRVEA